MLAMNTGTPEPGVSASVLNPGVACSLFELGQSPKAIKEASRGGQTYLVA